MAPPPVVACFHLPPPNKGTRRTYWALLSLMAASLRRAAPEAELHLLTHAEAEVPDGLPCARVFRRAAGETIKESFATLMLAEALTWSAYVRSDAMRGPTVLMDVDMLMQRSPFALFDGGFDIGLTYTTEPSLHAFNAGVILIDPARRDRVVDFFARLAASVAAAPPDQREWYGDQIALARLMGAPDVARWTGVVDQATDGVRVRAWPADDWNASHALDGANKPVFAALPHAGLVHFKGERKGIMLRYATEVLGIPANEDAAQPGGWRIG